MRFWNRSERTTRSTPKRPTRNTSRSTSGKSTEVCNSLDQSQHRCSSIESLLSLEQSLVTYDDDNNMRLIPLVCLDTETNGAQNTIPTEVDIQDTNNSMGEVAPLSNNDTNAESNVDIDSNDDHILNAANDSSLGLDISEKLGISELGVEEEDVAITAAAAVPHKSSETGVDYRSFGTNDPPVSCGTAATKSSSTSGSMPRGDNETLTNAAIRPAIRTTTSNNNRNSLGSVRFGEVQVHEHELILATSSVPLRGPPIGLGWNCDIHKRYSSVEDHLNEKYSIGNPRSLQELHQPSQQRVDRLLDAGYTLREIRASVRNAGIVRTKRVHSARYSSRNKWFICNCLRSYFMGPPPPTNQHRKKKHNLLKKEEDEDEELTETTFASSHSSKSILLKTNSLASINRYE